MAATITHDAENQEFRAVSGVHGGELAYSRPAAGVLDFTHTFVDEELRGQGVGEDLARAGLAYAREQGAQVRTSCQFMAAFVRRHPEYQELLDSSPAQ